MAVLILGATLTTAGSTFAFEHVVSSTETTESIPPSQTNQGTSALGSLALALSAGNEAVRALRGSKVEAGQKERLKLSIPGMECDVDRIAYYISCYSSRIGAEEEADNIFTRLIDELQSVSLSGRWRLVKEKPRVNSIRRYTYQNEDPDAHLDIDLLDQVGVYMVTIFGWPAT